MSLFGDKKMKLEEEDIKGLQEIRTLITEFLINDKSTSEPVRTYLVYVFGKDEVLLPFLWGRKYRADYAWQTLKRNIELRLNEYPELFPEVLPANAVSYVNEKMLFGVLKSSDNNGRRVLIFNASEWDPDRCSLELLFIIFVSLIERLLKDEKCAKNGCTYIHHCAGVGMKQAKEYSLTIIRKLIKVFWHSFPIQLKSLYYVQVPSFLHCTFAIAKTFFPKKLKERLVVSPVECGFEEIHKIVSPNNLPEFLGGTLKFYESMDEDLCTF